MGIVGMYGSEIKHCEHLNPHNHKAVWLRNSEGAAPILFVDSHGAFLEMSKRTLVFSCEKCFIRLLESAKLTHDSPIQHQQQR